MSFDLRAKPIAFGGALNGLLGAIALFASVGSAFASQSILFERPLVALPEMRSRAQPHLLDASNELCAEAHLTSLVYTSVSTVTAGVDWCQVPVAQVIPVARGTIERIGDLNERIATSVGIPVADLFGPGYGVEFVGTATGSIDSSASYRGVSLKVLPNWTLADFPSMVYAHEIVHTLSFNPGPLGEALRGLVDHPFVTEGFPDLVSAVVHDSRIIRLGENDFPPALRDYRDAGAVPSLDDPFGHFYYFASLESIGDRCGKLDLAHASKPVAQICAASAQDRAQGMAAARTLREANGISATPLDAANLSRSFQAEDCTLRSRNGMVLLKNCDPHQFSYPLVSFFFRLREIAGRFLLADFVAALRRLDAVTPAYECRYAKGTRALGGASFDVRIRPLLGALASLRESLPPADRNAFDLAWSAAGFAKLVDLDRIYRNELFPALSQLVAQARNPAFASSYGCGESSSSDPEQCRVDCVRKPLGAPR